MTYTVFKTNTLLDMRAITVMGLNAKPNSKSPIGYFGTGLKMAIATLLRNNIPIRMFIGPREYIFETKDAEFRGSEYKQIFMRRKRSLLPQWDTIRLPFTTQLARNWELWQAYRELEANTRDENGETFIRVFTDVGDIPQSNRTKIIVESDEFSNIALWDQNGKDPVFLQKGTREPTISTDVVQVFDNQSDYIFYRGMRVMKLDRPSFMTYNILQPQDLTEDRTLKDQWYVPHQLLDYFLRSTDKELIGKFMNATSEHWESEWPLDWTSSHPGTAFLEVVDAKRKAPLEVYDNPLVHTPIYRSPRVDTMLKQQITRSKPAGESLQARFKHWWSYTKASELFEEDVALCKEVQKALDNQQEDPF